MERVNINIWAISEKVNLIQKTIVSTTVGKNPLESKKWSSPHSQQKSPKCSTLVQSQKQQYDLSLFPRQTSQHHSSPSLCPNYQCWSSWSRTVLWRLPTPSRTNTKKRCPFHDRGPECKSRKSGDTWSNRKVRTWSTKWSMTKANRVLPKEYTLVIANTLSNNT